ncbi:GntR family transcriptional regulator [Paraglaciecola aquimarina]|uniref:GntR family transcriptional regulator n=1 Tax=Paraglaciecola aquimarina TaxID=1235557 RepID=A0ABU3SRK7_9ALTE|nr:GntR family transcriptional regulator [Paraglaciecola aquimarina]MDU0352636.1 GntR family transcriptional regulator [Paraglaciecola aquimarina]
MHTNEEKPGGLTTELVESLRSEILKGSYKVGDKLPSSKIIEEQTQVSRTVVREAIAQLKAEGLVDSRQGVGVVITERKNDKSFQIDKVEFESIL